MTETSVPTTPPVVTLTGAERERAVPVLVDAFTGWYRWHSKRALREVPRVRAIMRNGEVVAVTLLDDLAPELGYVYYVAVHRTARRQGLAGRLLDDALALYRAAGKRIVYAAAESDNEPSIALFGSRGFRIIERDEPGWQEGGMGPKGLRRRMWIVPGEVVLGVPLAARSPTLDDLA